MGNALSRPSPDEIVRASASGELKRVSKLARQISNPIARDQCCMIAAESAAKFGHSDVVECLVQIMTEQSLRDKCCMKAAECAVQSGHIEVTDIITQLISNEKLRDQCYMKSLAATMNMSFDVTKVFVERISDSSTRDQCCMEAMESAPKQGHLEAVKFLAQTITDPTIKQQCCSTCASSAATKGHVEVVSFLVQAITDQAIKDQCCIKAAEAAAKLGQLEVTKFLVLTIADQDSRNQCCLKATESAKKSGQLEVMVFLTQTVTDQDLKDQCSRITAEYAAEKLKWDVATNFVSAIASQLLKQKCSMKMAVSAAAGGHLKVVQCLVKHIIDVQARDQSCMKAAESAARRGHFSVVKHLVRTIEVQSLRDQCCMTASMSAAQNSNLDMVKHLIETIEDRTLRDQCCMQTVDSSDGKFKWEIVIFLVATITDSVLRQQCSVMTMESAAIEGHLDAVEYLVKTIEDQDVRDRLCMTTVDSASIEGHLDVVTFLLHTISTADLRDKCCLKSVESAASLGEPEIVDYLVQNIADPAAKDQCCARAVRLATLYGHWNCVSLLISTIADAGFRDQCCMEVAETAAKDIQLPTLDMFLKCIHSVLFPKSTSESAKAIPAIPPHWLARNSPLLALLSHLTISGDNSILLCTLAHMQPAQIIQLLCLCITHGHVALARTLLNERRFSKEHVDLPDSTGATALMLAADAGHHELIEQLLDAGASVRVQDSQGRTALSRACETGHMRAAKVLTGRGADASDQDECNLIAQHLQIGVHSPGSRSTKKAPVAGKTNSLVMAQLACFESGPEWGRQLSEDLHRMLSTAGFTQERVKLHQRLADWLEIVARDIAQDDRQITGSFAEGWANCLEQVNGRTAVDSDIGWTVLADGKTFHLNGCCDSSSDECCIAKKLSIKEGHAQVHTGSGSQPAVTVRECGVRPAQKTCHAVECCSQISEPRVRQLLFNVHLPKVHLVTATRPNSTNELRVSFSFHEKQIMRDLSTVQGQLFIIIKFIFKRHLPLTLKTPGLKTYHAKTLLFFMLGKHREDADAAWQPQNLIALLEESLDMMLSFINCSSSPDECMPHFFMPDAPLYFKNAGIGGDFDKTKSRVRDRLSELRRDASGVVEQMKRHVRPLKSESFYFHLFNLLPLTLPPVVKQFRDEPGRFFNSCTDVFNVVCKCITDLQSDSADRGILTKQLNLLEQLQWCKCTTLCLTVIVCLKFKFSDKAKKLLMELLTHQVKRDWKPHEIEGGDSHRTDSDWAWRFCLPCDSPPQFPFLPEFTQTLFTARLSQPRSSHLYVNFRCLSWSLQAELLRNDIDIPFDEWFRELQEDPDLEELLTLAHYSDCREHVEFCLQQMETLRDERRVAMEIHDEESIGYIREKLETLGSSCS